MAVLYGLSVSLLVFAFYKFQMLFNEIWTGSLDGTDPRVFFRMDRYFRLLFSGMLLLAVASFWQAALGG